MAPPRLTESANEQIVGGVEEEHLHQMGASDTIDCGSRVAANVERYRNVPHPRLLERRHRAFKHGGRKVLDTVKAQIFKRFYCLAQAGTGEPRDEDDAQRTHMKLFSPERAT